MHCLQNLKDVFRIMKGVPGRLFFFKRFVCKVEVYKETGLFSLELVRSSHQSVLCPSFVTNGKSQLKPYRVTSFILLCSFFVCRPTVQNAI